MRHRLVIFDLDGTLYRGSEVIPGAVETVKALRERGIAVRFLTNNSGSTRQALSDKLCRMGFSAAPQEVWGTGPAAADYCLRNGYQRVFWVGEPGLKESLEGAGLTVTDGPVDAVVAGICRTFTYAWLDAALQQLLAGAAFIATNRDGTYPIEGGHVQPGAGAIIAALEAASGVTPTVLGKPSPYLVEQILVEAGVSPCDALVVGDRPNTDLEAGRAAGCDTWLVLSGVTSELPEGQVGSADVTGLIATSSPTSSKSLRCQ